MKDTRKFGYILGSIIAGVVACCLTAIIVAVTIDIVTWII